MDRRKFLIGASAATLTSLTACSPCHAEKPLPDIKNTDPKKALVIWYSQTGHTARMGRLMAKVLEEQGLEVVSGAMSETPEMMAAQFDLLICGCPVQYMDAPKNVQKWMEKLPDLSGIAVASYVTYGGPGHNVHNTGCHLLELLAEKGAAPVGQAGFGNMSTFSPTWSAMKNPERILKYRDLPNENTYEQGRIFAKEILQKTKKGQAFEIDREFSMPGMMTAVNPMWWTKKMVEDHHIDKESCIECGTCAATCPVGAIGPDKEKVNTDACIACFGCVNNCPADAVKMRYLKRPVYGWVRFCAEKGIDIKEPKELQNG